MIKKITLIVSFLFSQILFCQKSDPVYYDKDWKKTTKANASYYRIMPLNQHGELVLLQDFYIDGTPQFEGYIFKNDENAYVGDIVWYDENGHDSNFRQHRNDTKNLTLTYYHHNGKIRKKVQYKDRVKDGETIIYGFDGKVLMKGIFAKGRPASGSFEKIKNSGDYDYNAGIEENPMLQEESPVTTEDAVMVPPQSPLSRAAEGKPQAVEVIAIKREKQKTVTEKIFWKNSRQIAQETVYEIGSYDFKSIEQKNYDQSGKLVQFLNETHFKKYGSDIANGTEYKYYLQNNFATGIKSFANFVNGEKSGKEVIYFPKGTVSYETTYRNGLKEGEEMVFSENGSVKNKRMYRQNEPFNGNFEEHNGDITLNLNYVNGLKEGEAIAINQDKQIIAKGIYKSGKPFNGTFVVETDNEWSELIAVENFKKSGLQKVFSYRLENLKKTYTVENEKLNGITTFYDDGKPVTTLEYKDDKPYNGTLIGSEKTSVYKNGKIVKEIIYEDRYNKTENNIQKQKLYENGIIVKIKDYSFEITENPQSHYEGIFKNGKPYWGYFETDASREFRQVDYYENGIPKFQYSNDYLKNMDNYKHQYYDIKSTYKDGKIYDGVEYRLNDRQFMSRYWKNGVLHSFDWDLFAMHYFNRIHFELNNSSIEIRDLKTEKKAVITIDISQKKFKKQLSIDGKVIGFKTNGSTEADNKDRIILYYKENGKIISKMIDTLEKQIEPSEGTDLFYKVYLSINQFSTVQEIFNTLSDNIISNKLIEDSDENGIITGLRTDSSGKPDNGILITPTQDNTYTLQLYLRGKLIKTAEKVIVNKVDEEVEELERID